MNNVKHPDRYENSFQIVDRDEWLEQMMNEYGASLKKLSYNYLKDWKRAEDVVQEVFITCYTQIDSFRGESSFKTWLYRVTINKCKDILKSSAFKTRLIDTYLLSKVRAKENTPEKVLLQESEKSSLTQCVLALPIKYREVIIFFYFEELTIPEISQLLQINQNTVKTRLKRAKLLLKKSLERIGEDGR